MDVQTARMQAAHMVACGNQKTPSIKKAVWGCILSANNELGRNALQAAVLTKYVQALPLPHDALELQEIIAQESGWRPPENHCQYIIDADVFCSTPSQTLQTLETMPQTAREWITWRKLLVKTFKGISWKTASFVALLMWPQTSPFGIVDRHILARYGKADYSSKISSPCKPAYLRYREIERKEWHDVQALNVALIADGAEPCRLGIGHWALWDDKRGKESPEHDLLSAYNW
jgi:thermostable 8-oxoguanine DNA glycosylase